MRKATERLEMTWLQHHMRRNWFSIYLVFCNRYVSRLYIISIPRSPSRPIKQDRSCCLGLVKPVNLYFSYWMTHLSLLKSELTGSQSQSLGLISAVALISNKRTCLPLSVPRKSYHLRFVRDLGWTVHSDHSLRFMVIRISDIIVIHLISTRYGS